MSEELNSPVSLPVASKRTEDRHPDDKWLKDALKKPTKCQSAARDIPCHTLHSPRVTVVVPVNGHILSGHTLHTPRVTVVVPVSSHTPHTSQVTVGVPGSRRSRKQNKHKQNEKYENQKSNYLSSVTVVDCVKLTRLPSQSQVSSDTSVLKSSIHSSRLSGHTLHTPRVTVVVPVSGQGHGQHTPRVTARSPSQPSGHWSSGHTLHTPRVTVVVPVSDFSQSGHTPHTPRVTVVVPVSGPHTTQVTVDLVHRSVPRSRPPVHCSHTPRVTVYGQVFKLLILPQAGSRFSSHGRHTPRVTARSRSRQPSHGQHTPRVTARSRPGLIMHTPRVTAHIPHSLSRKMRNKAVKQVNGNGKNSLLISHWNLGSKKWINKINQIQALVDTDNPDVLFISEANLDESTPLHETIIEGYEITLPKTVVRNGTARLVLLTKESLEFELMDTLMDDIVSSIWIKILSQGAKKLLICGVYREHQYLNQLTDWSLQPAEQVRRWSQFLRQVETARISATCHLIGDFNLDFMKWNAPDFAHLQMINNTKDSLETGGFFQQIEGVTRSWPGQTDSLIDHIWTNEPQKMLKVSNAVRSVADHNVISLTVRTKGRDTKRLDTRRRSYKNFDPVVYRSKLAEYNWSEIYELEDVDIANDFIESRIVKTLDEMCPYRTIQYRKECKTWLTSETKAKMKERDAERESARLTGDPDSWKSYRAIRNAVNRSCKLRSQAVLRRHLPASPRKQ